MNSFAAPAVALFAFVALVEGGEPIPLGSDMSRQLALDPRVFVEKANAQLVMGTVAKHERNPLFPANEPWENATNNLYPNMAWDAEARRFKLWYKCVLADAEAKAKQEPPAIVHDVGWYLLYATSADGLAWEKPHVGQFRFGGSTENNAVAAGTANAGVTLDTHDVDPARRYKMVFDTGLGQVKVRFSPDGTRWGEPAPAEGLTPRTGDTHNNAWWDPRLRRYVRFVLGERLVARSESRDFIHWENTRLALRSTLAEGRARQLYAMTAFPCGSGYIGLLMCYNVGSGRTVDCELAWSPDTVEWQRVLPGTPFIPRGPAGSYDAGCIYAQAGAPVVKDGRVWIFYGGSTAVHQGWKRSCLPCLATLRPDGFAALARVKADAPAVLTTAPLRLTGAPRRVSAEITGSVMVELLDAAGRRLAESRALTGDVADGEVRWATDGDFTSLAGQTVKLRFTLRDARLYSFVGAELVRAPPAPATPPRPAPANVTARVRHVAAFEDSAEGWRGQLKHAHVDGAIRATRDKHGPYIVCDAAASGGVFSGDLAARYGGAGVRISWRQRTDAQASRGGIELFAKDIAQWSHDAPAPTADWSPASVMLRYDWTDDEARAAGWRPAINAFSWRETISHVGRVALVPLLTGDAPAFDVDDFTIETAE